MTVETIVTDEMVAINNRPRRRIGLNGHKGLNKTGVYGLGGDFFV